MNTPYIGLMSGTSLDGVDGVLVDFDARANPPLTVRAHAFTAFTAELRAELTALNRSGEDEIHRAALAANALARMYAQVVRRLLGDAGVSASDVVAIGAHGQTVRHRPREFDGIGYTVQLNQAALLAELTGIDVVADFRSRDVAAGGQGAPLVPAFHRAMFASAEGPVAVLNLGGIANLTLLQPHGSTSGFDCGPGNVLLDLWIQRHLGQTHDAAGAWAAGGRVSPGLLACFLEESFFDLAPPKSTGRDLFNAQWLDQALRRYGVELAPRDVQATLVELTAGRIAAGLERHGGPARELLVCGGGVRNTQLMRRLEALLPGVVVQPTDARGLVAEQVEAAAFAWLAKAFVERRTGNLVSVTGAAAPRVLGALYPGR